MFTKHLHVLGLVYQVKGAQSLPSRGTGEHSGVTSLLEEGLLV